MPRGDILEIEDVRENIEQSLPLKLTNKTKNEEYDLNYEFSQRQKDIIIAGGLLNYTKNN